jgi:hypothetical protein
MKIATCLRAASVALAGALALGSAAAADDCNAACLSNLADRVLAAMAAHNRGDLPLGHSARYTENGQQIPIGDGAWGTLASYTGEPKSGKGGAPSYRLDIVDAESFQVATLRGVVENGTPGVLALRLKARGGVISEIEAVVIRDETLTKGGGTATLMQPRLLVPFVGAKLTPPDSAFDVSKGDRARPAAKREDLLRAPAAYFAAVVKGGSGVAQLADHCARRENGTPVTGAADSLPLDAKVPGYKPFGLGCADQIDSGFFSNVGGVRLSGVVADPVSGLAFTVAAIAHPAKAKSFETPGYGRIDYPGPRLDPKKPFDIAAYRAAGPNMIVPTTDLAVYVFKVGGGKIERIESFERGAPFGMGTGWGE